MQLTPSPEHKRDCREVQIQDQSFSQERLPTRTCPSLSMDLCDSSDTGKLRVCRRPTSQLSSDRNNLTLYLDTFTPALCPILFSLGLAYTTVNCSDSSFLLFAAPCVGSVSLVLITCYSSWALMSPKQPPSGWAGRQGATQPCFHPR